MGAALRAVDEPSAEDHGRRTTTVEIIRLCAAKVNKDLGKIVKGHADAVVRPAVRDDDSVVIGLVNANARAGIGGADP